MPKPCNKKKKFIDRKNESSVTFKLIHRGQRDPLAADEDAPQRVLQTEQRDHGVFFEDDYNYLQHLKNPKDQGKDFSALDSFLIKAKELKVNLPASVLPSKEPEEEIGLLNKAAPRRGPLIDWDPDIVAALDEDFDYENPENLLEDDFMDFANASAEEVEEGDDSEGDDDHYFDTDEERDEVGSLENFSDEETKSRFTNYSMSSSIIRRNEGLKLLDDKFENFYAEYDEINIGSLAWIVKEFEKKKAEERTVNPKLENQYAFVNEDDVEGLKEDFERRVQVQDDDGWDAETILSTYSNIYNHPKLISERKVS
ncbi:LTV1 -like protein [Caligus rogercresseyi]|uniref:Protein LTV1 homolog n=1 Tax=Caligus rogercresseyi TaxID=217165 RepID=A0A7T8KGK7_CALRO|nr:LTV1 -like protein [Caligus rogercresseyi]